MTEPRRVPWLLTPGPLTTSRTVKEAILHIKKASELESVARRSRGMKIGWTMGYLSEMKDFNRKDAARQGYEPDSTVCASDVPAGRSYPYMCLQNVINLQVWPVSACVKVDDTVPGIEEGLNSGMWTVGLAMSGNEIGLPLKEVQALAPVGRDARRPRAYLRTRHRRPRRQDPSATREKAS